MIHIRLCKGLSYSGIVTATKDKPDIFVEDEATAKAAIASGYFKFIEGDETVLPPEPPAGTITKLDVMTVKQLTAYAKEHDIDLAGATVREDIVQRILEVEQQAEKDDISGQFTNNDNG